MNDWNECTLIWVCEVVGERNPVFKVEAILGVGSVKCEEEQREDWFFFELTN